MSDEDYDYGDDDFEDLESSGVIPPKSARNANKDAHQAPSPQSKVLPNSTIQHSPQKMATNIEAKQEQRTDTAYSEDYNPDDDDDDENESKQDGNNLKGVVDLESYLKNMLSSPVQANEDENDNDDQQSINKELQPLDGVLPDNDDQRRLAEKFGYSPDKKVSPLLTSQSPFLAPKLSNSLETSKSSSKDHVAGVAAASGSSHVQQLLAMAGVSSVRSSAVKESTDAENALKVDSLLRDLFPARYKDKETPAAAAIPNKRQGGAKKTTSKKKSSHNGASSPRQYGLAAPRPSVKRHDIDDGDENDPDDDEENDSDGDGGGDRGKESYHHQHHRGGGVVGSGGMSNDLLGGLEQQMKMLKKELKAKDDKIQRLTEHSMMMGSQMDKLRGEVARLNARLHDAQMELEAKESRLVEVMRKKKKEKKKEAATSDASAGASAAMYEGEIVRLREREQALMDAVEELSSQNEDLIIKLRESMQRELELSSKRAQLVSHTVHREGGLPSIHEKNGGGYHSNNSNNSSNNHHSYAQANHNMLRAQTEPNIMTHDPEEFPSKMAGKKKKKRSSG